jgi:uncharacterized protein YprB with RNaseH-like and TPR domain
MLRSTFQLAPGLGPARERALWRHGIACWSDYSEHDSRARSGSPSVGPLSDPREPGAPALAQLEQFGQLEQSQLKQLKQLKPVRTALRDAIESADAALAARDVDALAARMPAGEHWRLFEVFANGAVYLDIETSDDVVGFAGISAIGVLDSRGPRLFLAGRDLQRFPEWMQSGSLLVTFNGLSFDLPILRRAFPDWQPPRAHIDLRHVLAQLGHRGTLKQLEEWLPALHLERPYPLRALNASGASALFHRGRDGDRAALRRFAEYNLYDTINLRTLMAYAYNGLVDRLCTRAPALRRVASPVAVPGRGDVLYDVSKLLLAL